MAQHSSLITGFPDSQTAATSAHPASCNAANQEEDVVCGCPSFLGMLQTSSACTPTPKWSCSQRTQSLAEGRGGHYFSVSFSRWISFPLSQLR